MSFVALLIFLSLATAQTPGTSPEVHPKLLTWVCKNDNGGGCTEQTSAVVLDALSHPVHQVENTDLGCGVWGSPPNGTVCPDEATCAKNCIVEGISDYAPYGVSTDGGSLTLSQLNSAGSTVSPRLYLLDNSEEGGKYEMLQLTGKELSFDVDISKLPCGMNGALYLSEMEADGGQSELNVGGAAYGTGYCDAQCFTFPFVNGVVSKYCVTLQHILTIRRATSKAKGLAAMKWTYGRQIKQQPQSHLTPATRQVFTNAPETNVPLTECVTNGDALTIHMPLDIETTMDPALQLTPAVLLLLLHNSRHKTVSCRKSDVSTYRMVKLLRMQQLVPHPLRTLSQTNTAPTVEVASWISVGLTAWERHCPGEWSLYSASGGIRIHL